MLLSALEDNKAYVLASLNGIVFIGSISLFLAAILLFAGSASSLSSSSLVMAQQQTTTTTTPGTTTSPSSSPSPPLTPEEQEQLTRLQNVIAATNLNLDETQKQIGGVVYTPRWSDPVWVEPDSASVLVAYCLPGEFAQSGQEILGGSGVGVGYELEVLESYEVALPQNFMAWMMVIGNEDRQNRYPGAIGVIWASDANDPQTRVVSPEEQQQINNVVQQITQVTSIDQVINNIININNATTPTTPPPTNTTTPQPGPEPPECPTGTMTFNPDTDACEVTVTQAPECPTGTTFNPDTDACEDPAGVQPPTAPTCPTGYEFNPATDQCEDIEAAVPQSPTADEFNPATDQCER